MKELLEKLKNKKVQAINDQQDTRNNFAWLKNVTLKALGALGTTFGVLTALTIPSVGVSTAALGTLGLFAAKKREKDEKLRAESEKEVENHLNQIIEKPPKDDIRLNQKRKSKIKSLKLAHQESTEKLTGLNRVVTGSLAVGAATGAAAVISGLWLPIVPIATLGVNLVANHLANKELAHNVSLERRIANLENDLEAIQIIRAENKRQALTTIRGKSKENSKKTIKTSSKTKTSNEKLVDNYIKRMAHTPTKSQSAKKLVK